MTLAAAAIAIALGTSIGSADERWIIEPGPEAADAQKLGAADVERAQALAKKKQFGEAAAVLEAVARKWPAAVHDCNLALAYLRSGELTKAQLVWDLAALRNGVRPKWCTGEVSTQLSDALRKGGYVPTTIDVAPSDAIVEVNGIAMRGMRTVWLKPGVVMFSASAQGRLPKAAQASIAAPVSRVAIVLEEPKVEPPPAPDAGVPIVTPSVTPDAAVVATPIEPVVAPDAGVDNSFVRVNGRPVGAKKIALVTMLSSGLSAALLGGLAYKTKLDANGLFPTDPAFEEQKQVFDNFAIATTICAGVSVVSAGFYIYFLVAGDTPVSKPGKIQVGGGPGDIGISFSGTFGETR
ncbi:MAG TPA: hypothetical protein VMZ53_13820 [Kofleriaceae bacterium]|nr:hypothetical protein [Kofleriaceae bacterium]